MSYPLLEAEDAIREASGWIDHALVKLDEMPGEAPEGHWEPFIKQLLAAKLILNEIWTPETAKELQAQRGHYDYESDRADANGY
jgi:hypothetical protein